MSESHLTPKIAREIKRKDILFSMAMEYETGHLIAGSSDSNLYAYDFTEAADTEPRPLAGHSSYVTGIALTRRWIVSGSYDGALIWWHRESGVQERRIPAHTRWIRGVVASPDRGIIASVADDMVCRVWNAETGGLIHQLQGHPELTPQHYPSMLFVCAFSPDGRHLATADKPGRIIVWDLESGTAISTLEAPTMYTWDPKQRRHSIGGIRSLAFSPDGPRLAAGGIGQIGNIDHLAAKARIEIFDWRKAQRVVEFPGDKFNGLVEHMAFHPNEHWLAVAGGDHKGFLIFLNPSDGKVIRQDTAPMHVHEFALNDQGDRMTAVGHHKIVEWVVEG